MSGTSRADCVCGLSLDPTVEYQRSECCGARLTKRVFHYACSQCGQIVPSRFLFDERVFNEDYFRKAMAESRERKRRVREELRLLLAESHSDNLSFTEVPDIDRIPGLLDALTDLLGFDAIRSNDHMAVRSDFRMEDYREVILTAARDSAIRFEAIPALERDVRLDRARRFTALIFMEHSREVWLQQCGTQIMVMPYETHD